MIRIICLWAAALAVVVAGNARAAIIPYSVTITTAYATSNPFPNRIDSAFIEPDTGYLQIANTGPSAFQGTLGTIAVSVFAGDLSFSAPSITLLPGAAVSIAIPDDASDVGGFNGPAYFFRPGVEVFLRGAFVSAGGLQSVDLMVADADIHSGVWRIDPRGLYTDSFVLQGGDPWGFDPGDDFELSQPRGVFVFSQTVAEPPSVALLGLSASAAVCACFYRRQAAGLLP
ncbi:MAG: hypothetical protein JO227_13165 [Acetobacteraceae bacterium]|nr:hypothetical protein [Acetobacteraceae bacterium]